MSTPRTQAPRALETPHWTLGDRLAAFRVLLPADPGPTVLAVGAELLDSLWAALPGSVVVEPGSRPQDWPDPGTISLVVVDSRLFEVEALRRLLAPGGVLAALGDEGQHVVYPSTERPEMVWRRDWPVRLGNDPVAWLRRRAGLSLRRTPPRLAVTGADRPTLADVVLADVERATGASWTLVGVTTAGRAVMRVRSADGELAVRLGVIAREDRPDDLVAAVVHDVPRVADLLPRVVARGTTAGHPWLAMEWVPRRHRLRWPWPRASEQWAAAESLVDELAAIGTGWTGPGWAERWCNSAELLPEPVRARWAAVLAPLEQDVPTSWCHGDLWTGNVLVQDGRPAVLDWDNASRDAPQGLDRLLLPALRDATHPDSMATREIMGQVDDYPALRDVVVGGRRWADWDRPHRLALSVAAVVLYLRNRSPLDLDPMLMARHLEVVEETLTDPITDGGEHQSVGGDRPSDVADVQAARTARGALWLATNGVVVKASQTVVLLTLAALLAPEALGLVALGTLVANVSAIVASLGTASALVYWRGDVQRAARTAVTLGATTAAALSLLLWWTAPWLASTLRAADGGADVIRGLTVALPCLAIAAVTNELLRRRLAFLRRIIPDTVSSVIGAVVAIVLVAGGSGVMALVVGQIVQAVLTMLLAWCVHPPVLPGWNRDDARGLLTYGGPYAGANLLELVQLNIDYIIVSTVLGAAALGQYSLAFRLSFMPYLIIVVVITGAAFPYLCGVKRTRLAPSAVVVMGATLTLVTPLCVGLLLLSDHLTVLGTKWAPGVPVVSFLAVYAVLLSVGQLVQTTLNAAGRPGISMALRLLHLVLLCVTLLTIADHGIVAVAIGQLVVATMIAGAALLCTRVVIHAFSLRALASSLRPALVGAVVMSLVMLAVRTVLQIDTPSPVSLLLLGSVGLVAYGVPVWLLDRQRLQELVRLVRRST